MLHSMMPMLVLIHLNCNHSMKQSKFMRQILKLFLLVLLDLFFQIKMNFMKNMFLIRLRESHTKKKTLTKYN